MPRKPQRLVPKASLQAKLPATVFDDLRHLKARPPARFASMSECLETILFWAMHQYYEHGKDQFVTLLARAKALALIENASSRVKLEQHRLHATVDTRTLDFLDELARLHPEAFSGKSDAFVQICTHVCQLYRQQAAYLLKSLEEVRRIHPKMNP